jgi:histidinol phosphatase-like enzyme (inositol monophosphatase family)
MAYERELVLARRTAWLAGAEALRLRAAGLETETKPDESPVTNADRASERMLVDTLTGAWPEDGVLGEEGSERPGNGHRRWIVDPIDGTRDFLRGNPLWAILIGLEVEGRVEAGVVTFPALGRQYWAARGEGAWALDGPAAEPRRMRCSKISRADQAVVCFQQWAEAGKRPRAAHALDFVGQFWSARTLGGPLDAMLIADGCAEVWIEPRVKPWDLAAISLILKESGCIYHDYRGEDTIYGGDAVAYVPGLTEEVRSYLKLGS